MIKGGKIISRHAITTKILITVVLLFMLSICIDSASAAASDTVYVNGSGGNDDNDGSSWEWAKLTINNATGTVTNGGTVIIADGNYSGPRNTHINITKNMTIKGQSQKKTVINGTGTNWIFYVNDVNVTIQNLTVTDGTGYLRDDRYPAGGAVYNEGNLTISNCTFSGNIAGDGGAIFNGMGIIYDDMGKPISIWRGNIALNGCTFTGNTANSGGVIYNDGTITALSNCTFTNNTADGGGVIYNGDTIIALSNCTFTGNTAHSSGGVIYNGGNSKKGIITALNNCTFTNNTANVAGTIYNEATITNLSVCTFSGNIAGNGGGAIDNDGVIAALSGCTFNNNKANYCGAIGNSGTINLSNCTFSGNTAANDGGAIYNGGYIIYDNDDNPISTKSGNIALNGCTFTGNTAENGGVIYNDGGSYDYDGTILTWSGNVTLSGCTFTNNIASINGGVIWNNGSCTMNSSTFLTNTATYGGVICNKKIAEMHFNRIIGNIANKGSAIYCANSDLMGYPSSVNAQYNWWGSNANPEDITNLIAGLINNVNPRPWLVLTVATNPTTINNGNTTTVTADLQHDSFGIYHNPADGHVPDGIAVTVLSTSLGTIDPTEVHTANGSAVTIFTAGNRSGIAVITAAVDEATNITQITVLLNDIYVSLRGNDSTGDGTSGNPFLTIKKGMEWVYTGGRIHLANGTYNECNISIIKNLTIQGQNKENTIINVQHLSRIFIVPNDISLTLKNLTLVNGSADYGGAIYNNGTLNVDNCTFTGNSATVMGGAICNIGKCTVNSSNFINNAAAVRGGAIYNYYGDLIIHFSRIVGNNLKDVYNNDLGSTDAEYNWWGSNDGPSGKISGVTVSKWMVLTLTASPTYIKSTGTSDMTADLCHDNNGVYHDPKYGHVPDGTPVTFKTTCGTIGSSSSTVNGAARSTLKGESTAGTANVSAAADNQTMTTSVVIEDSIAPTVTCVDPTNKAVNVPINKTIKVTFSESIKPGNGWIELKNRSGTIIPITTSINGTTLTITPLNPLKEDRYAIILHTGSLTDLAGNSIALWSSNFCVGTSPTVKTVDPVNNAVNVPANKVIKITFSETVKTGNNWIELKNSNGTLIPFTTNISGNVLTIKPTISLAKGVKYTVILHTGCVTDLAGNKLALYSSVFTVVK